MFFYPLCQLPINYPNKHNPRILPSTFTFITPLCKPLSYPKSASPRFHGSLECRPHEGRSLYFVLFTNIPKAQRSVLDQRGFSINTCQGKKVQVFLIEVRWKALFSRRKPGSENPGALHNDAVWGSSRLRKRGTCDLVVWHRLRFYHWYENCLAENRLL